MMKKSKSESESSQSNGKNCIDHISELPNSILQHILSFLQVKDAIKTSLLSRRWRSVWAEVPVLRFCHLDDEPIDKTLANYRGNIVEKLDIRCKPNRSADKLIRFSTEHNVAELHLVFYPYYYELPQFFYSNSSLRILEATFCNFKVRGCVSWTSLKVLSILSTPLDNDDIERILLGSPKLEYLELRCVDKITEISVSSSNFNLKEVVINNWKGDDDLEISGPNIRSLSLSTYRPSMPVKLGNLSSLVEFNIQYAGDESLTRLLEKLHYVQKLTILARFSKVPTICHPLKCKSLTVLTDGFQWDFQGIIALLQNSPHLEKITINMCRYWWCFVDDTKYWELIKSDVPCDHLKVVEINGFELTPERKTRRKFLTLLVEFLLKNATALEKVVIYTRSRGVNKLIKSFPRASANVGITVVTRRTSFPDFNIPGF